MYEWGKMSSIMLAIETLAITGAQQASCPDELQLLGSANNAQRLKGRCDGVWVSRLLSQLGISELQVADATHQS